MSFYNYLEVRTPLNLRAPNPQPSGPGGGIIPSNSHADMCHPLGMVVRPIWSEIGYTFCLIILKVVDRRNYSRDFQFPLRINVKISEHAQNFNVFKPRLVCRRILILPSGSSGNSQKSEILKNLKFSKI